MYNYDAHINVLCTVPMDQINALLVAIDAHPDLWAPEHERTMKGYEGLAAGTTEHIILRDMTKRYGLEWENRPNWEEWQDLVEPIVTHVTSFYDYGERATTARIVFAKIFAGKGISRHIDGDPSLMPRGLHKIHVPLRTAPEVDFEVEDQIYHLEVGQAYEVNNRVMHAVSNRSNIDRIHLIFNCIDSGR